MGKTSRLSGLTTPRLCLAALIGLGLVIAAHPTVPAWDTAILLRLHRYATPGLNQSVAVLTDLGTVWGVLPATLGLVAWAFLRRHWRAGWYLLLAMAGAFGFNLLAKLLWQRVRPALWDGVPYQSGYSYPSGHATYSLAFVLAVTLLCWDSPKRLWIAGIGAVFAIAIGLSRVYLGVHYPSDIIGGWLLATAWVVGLYRLMFRDRKPSLENSQRP
jgi:membrane-associated phospholipid phosphatase